MFDTFFCNIFDAKSYMRPSAYFGKSLAGSNQLGEGSVTDELMTFTAVLFNAVDAFCSEIILATGWINKGKPTFVT